MKLMLIHQIFVTPEEGGGTRHYEMCKYLAKKGHEIVILGSDTDYLSGKKREKKQIVKEGMNIYFLKTFGDVHKGLISRGLNFLSFSISNFLKGLFIKDIDIIWSTSPPLFQAFTSLILAKIKRKKFLFEVRDLWLDFAVELGIMDQKSMTYKFLKFIEKMVYKYSDEVIVNSPGFIPYIQPILPGKRVKVFSNGVDVQSFESVTETEIIEKRKEFGVENKFVVLYTGNLGIANDIETIIETAKLLQPEYRDIKFLLFGGGLKKEEFKAKIMSLNLTNIEIHDSRPKSEMPSIISMADVCVATLKNIPLFSTVYPNKVFDYMACKKPTILAIDGVIREVISESQGGICISPEDPEAMKEAILLYFQNKDKMVQDGKNAYEYVKKCFDRSKIADDFNKFLVNWVTK